MLQVHAYMEQLLRNRSKHRRTLYWVCVALYCGIIYFISSFSGMRLPDVSRMINDKVIHAVEYGVLSLLLFLSINATVKFNQMWHVMVAVVMFCMIWGGLDEFHQSFVPYRQPDIYDVVADTIGAIIVQATIYIVYKFTDKQNS